MATHWTDKRACMALLGRALRERGWTLYGWHKDESDSMTDYYQPETWDGIAMLDGAVVVVAETSTRDPGGVDKVRSVRGDDCDACGTTGADPSGEMFVQTGGRSPIPYFGACMNSPEAPTPELRGRKVCSRCNGRGWRLKSEPYREPWPIFQANPPRRLWHVERGGRILASGATLYNIHGARYTQGRENLSAEQKAGVAALGSLADRITKAAECAEAHAIVALGADVARPETGPHPAVDVRAGKPGNVELLFEEKPDDEIRAELKAAGFRWFRAHGLWYGPAHALPKRYALPEGLLPEGGEVRDPGEDAALAETEAKP